MKKEYKIEKKPTIYHIELRHGEYSDYGEDHYFIKANDPKEAQELFKRYWKDILEEGPDYMKYDELSMLIFSDGERYNPFNIPELHWGLGGSWDEANTVRIEMLSIIYFQEIR